MPAALVAVGLVSRPAASKDGLVGRVTTDLLSIASVLPVAKAVRGEGRPVAQESVAAVHLRR